MNRLIKCVQFQLKNMAVSTLIFTGIYYGVTTLLIIFLGVSINGSSGNGSFNSGYYIGAAIFSMVYMMSNYKSMLNYLMLFGNTRKNIFFSFVATSVIMSAALALISMLTQLIEGFVSEIIGYRNSNSILSYIYGNTNPASEFLFYAVLFLLISSFAMLYGSLAYKLGKAFITVFWVGFGLSWVFLPSSAALNPSFARFLVNALTAFFRLDTPGGILLASVNFIITAILLAAVTYLISARQSQTA